MTISLLSLAALILLALTAEASAQDRVRRDDTTDYWIGAYGGPALTLHSAIPITTLLGPGLTSNASGIGYVAGIGALVWLDASVWAISWEVEYGNLQATSRDRTTGTFDIVTDDAGADPVRRSLSLGLAIDVSIEALTNRILYHVQVLDSGSRSRFAIEVGPWTSLVIASRLTESITLGQSEPGHFANTMGLPSENNGRTLHLYSSHIPDASILRLGVLGGVRYSRRLTESLDLWTALRYELPLIGVTQTQGRWTASALTLTAGLLLDL